MTVRIARRVLHRIVSEAEATPTREVCGLLLGSADRITEALSCINVAPDPLVAFEIDPAQLIAAHRAERNGGSAILGCYHSHLRGAPVPSPRDAAAAAPDGWLWLIAAERGTELYRATEHGTIEGRFHAGRHVVED